MKHRTMARQVVHSLRNGTIYEADLNTWQQAIKLSQAISKFVNIKVIAQLEYIADYKRTSANTWVYLNAYKCWGI